MLKVGLTGGIATGKSHALREFRNLGAYTIDADEIAHRVIAKGQPAYPEIVQAFGAGILGDREEINRKALGTIVFADEKKLQKLNSIVHPRVFAEEEREMAALEAAPGRRSPIVITDAALMIETGSYRRYDKIIVVFCVPELQFARLVERDGISSDDAALRISRQMPISEKARYADYLIENSGKYNETLRQIRHIYTCLTADHAQKALFL